MNYGYDETTPKWKEERKEALLKALAEKLPCRIGWVAGGVTPYLELDNLYCGVRIRKITNISDEDTDAFIERADKIYDEIMGD